MKHTTFEKLLEFCTLFETMLLFIFFMFCFVLIKHYNFYFYIDYNTYKKQIYNCLEVDLLKML